MREDIYPITALQRKPNEIKEAASKGIVHVTEQGSKAFVFCSEDVFENYLDNAIEEAVSKALYEQAFSNLVEEGLNDYESGNFFSLDEGFEEANKLRTLHKADAKAKPFIS